MEKINNKQTVDKIGARLAKIYNDLTAEDLPKAMAEKLRALRQAEESPVHRRTTSSDPASS